MATAVGNVDGEIAGHLRGRSFGSLADVEDAMRALDGTATKARLGANAIVGVSMALARALAAADGKRLFEWLPGLGQPPRLPVPCFNVLNGGAHAPNPLDFQEFMICPLGAPDLAEPEEVLALIVSAIEDAGYTPGPSGVGIALDPAASEFRRGDGTYRVNGQSLSSADLIDRYAAMVAAYPIWSIEDGFGEDDHDGWQRLTARLGDRIQLVGDDNFCTNPAIIAEAITDGIANAALIKLNQIGTVTETLEAMAICHRAGYGQIKTGAPARGERVAKYNRLIEIARGRVGFRARTASLRRMQIYGAAILSIAYGGARGSAAWDTGNV